jgi:hypothetical protein
MTFTDERILESYAKHRIGDNDPSSIFYAVCLEVLGYTPLGTIIQDSSEYNAFEERYQHLIGLP